VRADPAQHRARLRLIRERVRAERRPRRSGNLGFDVRDDAGALGVGGEGDGWGDGAPGGVGCAEVLDGEPTVAAEELVCTFADEDDLSLI
jgi:hypothetical protein